MACFIPLLLLVVTVRPASPQASGFVGFGGAGGGLGVWINGGVGITTPPATTEYAALQAWKAAITEDPSGVLATWSGPDVCSYRGVFCSTPTPDGTSPPPSGRLVVSAIDLNKANLRGTLVKELALLPHLSVLHLNSNRFFGTVPDALRDMGSLTELDLSNNRFSGPFPTPTLFIPNLVYLDLRFNGFSGEVPGELFLKDLDAIFLNNNDFEGQIPMSLWGSPASVVSLANNRFSGAIPPGFGGYMGSSGGAGIREILFLNNRLTGCIPEGLGFLTEMEVLDLSFNSLTGHLPGTLSCLSSVQVLNLAHNQLSGMLPDLVCSLRTLLNLTISYNFFSGFSPDCGRGFRSLWFDFSGNCIPGRGMQRPPPECVGVPGEGMSCLRIPPGQPVACGVPMGAASKGVGVGITAGFPYAMPSSP